MAIDLITGHQGQMHISAAQVANLNNSLMNGAGDHKVLRLIDGTVSFTGLIVSVANGYWRVNGYDMEIYEEEVVNIDPSSTGTSRIDKVFVEILQDIPSGIQRSELVVVKGEESAGTPVAPDAPTDPVLNTDLLLQCEEVCIVTVTEGAMTITDSTEEYTTVTPAELAIVEGKADQAILDAAAAQGTANTASTNAGYALQMIKKSSDAYSNTKAYKVGDHVIQNNTVYKCHTPCSAASWAVNSSCFTATSLTESVTELNSSLNQISSDLDTKVTIKTVDVPGTMSVPSTAGGACSLVSIPKTTNETDANKRLGIKLRGWSMSNPSYGVEPYVQMIPCRGSWYGIFFNSSPVALGGTIQVSVTYYE